MSRRDKGGSPKLEDLSLPARRSRGDDYSPSRRSSTSSTPRSCVSSEAEHGSNSPEEATSMVLAACPCCLMYVMLAEDHPNCPKCHNPVLLDFLHDNNSNSNSNSKTRKI